MLLHSAIFVLSSGLFFKSKFRSGSPVHALAGMLAILSGIFTSIQLLEIIRFISPSPSVVFNLLQSAIVACAIILSFALFFEIARGHHGGNIWWWKENPIEAAAILMAVAIPTILFAGVIVLYAKFFEVVLRYFLR